MDMNRAPISFANMMVGANKESKEQENKVSEARFNRMYDEDTLCQFKNVSEGSYSKFKRTEQSFRHSPMRVKTGVDFIDKVTNGGLYNGITVITGLPNLGKTTLLVQTAVSLSAKGYPVVYISKDMTQPEITLKAMCHIASEYCNLDLDLNAIAKAFKSGSLSDKLCSEYMEICKNMSILDFRFEDNADFIKLADKVLNYNISDVGECDEVVSYIEAIFEVYSNMYEKPPVFIIDSLQSLALYSDKAGKEAVDKTLAQIKYLQMKFGVPVLLVSNLNRASYHKSIELDSLKESGNIEYDASAILAIVSDEDFNDMRSESIRRVIIRNLKDRAGGYKECEVDFDVTRCSFTSVEDMESNDDSELGDTKAENKASENEKMHIEQGSNFAAPLMFGGVEINKSLL